MSASEREFQPRRQPADEPMTPPPPPPRSPGPALPAHPGRPSMRELLASCAAASAVSTPPRATTRQPDADSRDAA
ncbi:hypothetical protein ACWF94_08105 [Streptomyces sp. NPDC055078]